MSSIRRGTVGSELAAKLGISVALSRGGESVFEAGKKEADRGVSLLSRVPEFARLGFIELVDARSGIPDGIPNFLVRTIKRAKHQPIWIPGVNFPDDPWDIL